MAVTCGVLQAKGRQCDGRMHGYRGKKRLHLILKQQRCAHTPVLNDVDACSSCSAQE